MLLGVIIVEMSKIIRRVEKLITFPINDIWDNNNRNINNKNIEDRPIRK